MLAEALRDQIDPQEVNLEYKLHFCYKTILCRWKIFVIFKRGKADCFLERRHESSLSNRFKTNGNRGRSGTEDTKK